MSQKVEIKWFDKSEEHDYPAAESFLSLIYDARVATKYVQQLKRVPTLEFKAKDIVRASGLSLLDVSNFTSKKIARKLLWARRLPIFLVQDSENSRVIAGLSLPMVIIG